MASNYLRNQWEYLTIYEQRQLRDWVRDSHAACAGVVAKALEQKGIVKHNWNKGWLLTELGQAIFDSSQAIYPDTELARLQAENERLRAFVEEVERNAPTGDTTPTETFKWVMWVLGRKARALLASLLPGGAGAGEDGSE